MHLPCRKQYSHEPNIATVRHWLAHLGYDADDPQVLERQTKGEMVLNLMNEHLSVRPFFVGDDYTLADIALYAYTHVAHEGGYDLSNRPALKAWLDRVANQPGYVTMDAD